MQSSDASPSGMHRLLILLCVSIPSFMINLDSNIVAVSLPSIAHSMDANFADIEWVISAYTLSFASFLLPAGALADRFGRRPIFLNQPFADISVQLFIKRRHVGPDPLQFG